MLIVLQQADVFRQNTSLKVKDIWGDMGVDAWDEAMWRGIFGNELLVCTPQILLNLLRRAFIKVHCKQWRLCSS